MHHKETPENRFAERVGLSPVRIALMHGAMVVRAVVLFLAIDSRGGRLVAPGPAALGARGSSPDPWPDGRSNSLLGPWPRLPTGG